MIPELVIASGKGGTGKTSVAAAFATLAGKHAVMVDADVDAADLHLLLHPTLHDQRLFYGNQVAEIQPGICVDCGVCLARCRFGAVRHLDTSSDGHGCSYVIDETRCEGCGLCRHFCPAQAISMKDHPAGESMISSTANGPFVHARLTPGSGSSGKLVSILKDSARRIATAKTCKWILVDGPPGIGCPAIAALSGASLLLAVTEPTPAGEEDLARLLELANSFRLPALLCVNRWDINPEQTIRIEALALQVGVPSAGRIRYDSGFVAAQHQGLTYADFAAAGNPVNAWEDIQNLWNTVTAQLALFASGHHPAVRIASPPATPRKTP
jgi:MinD superfamily P-loop ATPase